MKILTRRKTVIKELANELAYLQIRADWWYYVSISKEKKEMASSELELVPEVREIANRFGILKDVYDEAYKIYDFRNSGKKDYVPNIDMIKKLDREFCEPRRKTRVFI